MDIYIKSYIPCLYYIGTSVAVPKPMEILMTKYGYEKGEIIMWALIKTIFYLFCFIFYLVPISLMGFGIYSILTNKLELPWEKENKEVYCNYDCGVVPDYDEGFDVPGNNNSNNNPGYHNVDGYYRSDGTYVEPYIRSNPDGNPSNNINQ